MKLKLKQSATNVGRFAKVNKPSIFTGIGIVGFGLTIYTAVKATPKAMQVLAEKEAEKYNYISETEDRKPTEEECKLTIKEKVGATWKLYVTPAIIGGSSIACFIGANHTNLQRLSATTALLESEKALRKTYKEEVINAIGAEEERKIQSATNQKVLDSNPVQQKEVIFTNSGETLVYEPLTGRYFKSDTEVIKRAVNQLNKEHLNDMSPMIELNDWFDAIRLEYVDIGDELGWYLNDGLLDVDFDAKLAADGKTPCLYIEYSRSPEPLLKY